MEEILNIASRFELMKNHLDEKSKRLFCAAEAKVLGHGGIKKVHKATNISEKTISKGLKELMQIDTLDKKEKRIRKSGGGRKKAIDKNPEIEKAPIGSCRTNHKRRTTKSTPLDHKKPEKPG